MKGGPLGRVGCVGEGGGGCWWVRASCYGRGRLWRRIGGLRRWRCRNAKKIFRVQFSRPIAGFNKRLVQKKRARRRWSARDSKAGRSCCGCGRSGRLKRNRTAIPPGADLGSRERHAPRALRWAGARLCAAETHGESFGGEGITRPKVPGGRPATCSHPSRSTTLRGYARPSTR